MRLSASTNEFELWESLGLMPGGRAGKREGGGAGATVQGMGWRMTIEMGKTDRRVISGQRVTQEMGLGGEDDTKFSSLDH